MKHIIDYIINKYTSVAQYLEECGLSAADQSCIRRNILSGGAAIFHDSQADEGQVDGVQSQAVSVEVEQFEQGVTSEIHAAGQKVSLQVMRTASSFLITGFRNFYLFSLSLNGFREHLGSTSIPLKCIKNFSEVLELPLAVLILVVVASLSRQLFWPTTWPVELQFFNLWKDIFS